MTTLDEARQWVDYRAPLTNAPGNRSPEALRAVLEQFRVETALRYKARAPFTYCNIFVSDATRALGCEIPHWLDKPRRELNANGICDWLEASTDWRELGARDAIVEASTGYPVVLAWRNPDPRRSGHVAMMLPDGTIAQAGKRNLFGAEIEAGFGRLAPLFYTHD